MGGAGRGAKRGNDTKALVRVPVLVESRRLDVEHIICVWFIPTPHVHCVVLSVLWLKVFVSRTATVETSKYRILWNQYKIKAFVFSKRLSFLEGCTYYHSCKIACMLSLIERFFFFNIFGGSFIGGSTVHTNYHRTHSWVKL